MRYLDKLLGEANNFKQLKTFVDRARDAEATGDKLDDKYMAKFSKTGRFASEDRKQKKRVIQMGATERERAKAATQANKLVSKVHLKGGGKGDGKPQGKLRRVEHAAYIQLGDIIAEAMKIPRKRLKSYKPRSNAPGTKERKLDDIEHKLKAARRDSEAQASREVSPVVASQRAVGITPPVNQNTIKNKAKDDNPQLDDKEEQLSGLRGKLQDRKLARIRKALG